jgi:uncharacterized protein
MNEAKDGKKSFPAKIIHAISMFSFQKPWLVFVICFLTCTIALIYSYKKLEFKTHRDDMISNRKWTQQNWKHYLKEFGQDDDMVVVAMGGDEKIKTEALEHLASTLANHPESFDRVFFKVDLQNLKNRSLLFLEPREIATIVGHLANMAPLLEFPFAWNLFTTKSITCEAHARIKQIEARGTVTGADKAFLAQFRSIIRSATSYLDTQENYQNPWVGLLPQTQHDSTMLSKPNYLISEDKSIAILLARPITQEKSEFVSSMPAVKLMRTILNEVANLHPEVQLGLTGLPVLEADEMAASQRDSTKASWLAFLSVLALYVIVYRSWRYPVLTITTLLVGTIMALGWVTLTIGHLNLLSATFAVMLIGLGDYGVLWVSAFDEFKRKGNRADESMAKTAITVGPGILTAACTTSLAFYAAMLADFQAVSEMGWIAGSGILFCALSCFTILPALLGINCRENQASTINEYDILSFPKVEKNWTAIFFDSPRSIVAGGLFTTCLFLIPALKISYDHNLLHLQSPSLDSVKWEKVLLEKMPAATWHAVTFTATREEAIEWKKKFEALPEVSQVAEIASMLPRDQNINKSQLAEIQHRLRLLPTRGAKPGHATPDIAGLKKELQLLENKTSQKNSLIDLDEINRDLNIFLNCLAKSDEDTSKELKIFEESVTGDLIENLHRLKEVSHPEFINVSDIPPPIRNRYLSENNQWLLRVFAKKNLWEYDNLREFVGSIQKVDARATGKPFTTLEGLKGMKAGFQWAGIYACIAIVMILSWDFRKPILVTLALLPLAMGLCITLGAVKLMGQKLNPANMIAFPILVGVGIDNAVHVIHDFLGRDRSRAYKLKTSTFKGIFVAGLTTVLGFGSLSISSHLGLSSLGLLLALGVSACMVCSVLWLPNLLQLVPLKARNSSGKSLPVKKQTQAA